MVALKLIQQFIYFSGYISSTESNVNMHIENAETVIDRLSIIWKSDL